MTSQNSNNPDTAIDFNDIADQENDEFYDDLDLNDDEINELLSHTIYIDDDHHHDENEEEEEEEDDDEEEMNSSEDISLLPNENKEDCQPKHLFKPLEEQILSQKLSQLSSTSHPQSKMINIMNEDLEKNLPDYLSKDNKSFQQFISQISSNYRIEDVQQMAILMYQRSMINLQKSLWMAYLKSGTGKLKLDQIDHNNGPHIWPKEVQSMVEQSTDENENENLCLTYVTKYLSELDNKMKQYEMEFNNTKKSDLLDLLQTTIETFVQKGLESVRLNIEYQTALIQYIYNDCVLELEFLRYHPTAHQQQLLHRLCHAKFQEEITKEEFHLLKKRLSSNYQDSPSLELFHEPLFDSIDNQNIRQQLYNQCIQAAQQAKEDMMKVCLSTAKAQMQRYHEQFNDELKQFWEEQRSLHYEQKLSEIMIHLLEQRYNNVSESVKCAYVYKTNLLRFNSVHS